jgi:amino acid adenylation domain-containing protein
MSETIPGNGLTTAGMTPDEKRELLARLLKEKVRCSRPYPMSFAQERLWIIDQFDPGPIYNISFQIRFPGAVDEAALRKTLTEVVRRHEALRTTFHTENEVSVQRIHPARPFELPVADLSGMPPALRDAETARLALQENVYRFNLSEGPLFRALLVKLQEYDSILLLTMHHIVSDGWSMGVLMREIGTLYSAFAAGQPSPLPELSLQYADFAIQQREYLSSDVLARYLSYWKGQLGGAPDVLELPTDRVRPRIQTFNGAWQSFVIGSKTTAGLQRICRRERVTLFMTLLAAFKILLARYTGQTDVVVGTPIANRNRAETEALIGFFVNTLVLRTDLSGGATALDVIRRVREVTLEAYEHQDLPFEKIVEELQPDRDLSHSPLFQVMFALQNAPSGQNGGTMAVPEPADDEPPPQPYPGSAKFDLTLSLTEAGDALSASFEYNTDLFEHATIGRMVGHFRTLLASIAADPERRIDELPMLTPAERKQVLFDHNQAAAEVPDVCLHELFEAQADRTPDATAVVFGGESLTYRELERRANQLARHLIGLGVGPGARVGICMERALEMVVGILGTFKAGAAYVPLDPTHPRDRLAFLIEDMRAPVLLALARDAADIPSAGAQILRLDADWPRIAAEDESRPRSGVTPDDVAVVFYTSGSTGKPKGTLGHGRGYVNLIRYFVKTCEVDASSRGILMTPFTFDASFKNIMAPLTVGGTLVLADDFKADMQVLIDCIARERATVTFITPSLLYALIEATRGESYRSLASLRALYFGGEPSDPRRFREWVASPNFNCRMIHEYGPAECSDAVTASIPTREELLEAEWLSIGTPVDNCKVYVLNDALEPQPIGVPGEIFIGDLCVTWGYLERPGLTAERFVPDPYDPGGRLYRTGDRARRLPNGALQFLGRTDNQVKIRGIRIELGEIEAALKRHERVRQVVVLARDDGTSDKRIVAYVVSADGAELDAGMLRAYVKNQLPDYMIPAAFVQLEAMPISPNGKIDRAALPSPDAVVREKPFNAPRNPLEEVLAGFWADVLGLQQVDIHGDFFDLGGHSLLATQVVSRVRESFRVDLPLRRIFETPTVAELAESMLADEVSGARVERTAEILLQVAAMSDDEVETMLGESGDASA